MLVREPYRYQVVMIEDKRRKRAEPGLEANERVMFETTDYAECVDALEGMARNYSMKRDGVRELYVRQLGLPAKLERRVFGLQPDANPSAQADGPVKGGERSVP